MKDSAARQSSMYAEGTREIGIPTHVYPYTAGIEGGLLGGLLMVIPALTYGVLSGHGPWYPANLVAAALLPELQSLPPQAFEAFSLSSLMVALAIHVIVAIGIGFMFAVLLPTLPGRPQIWALVVGPMLWLAATSIFLPTINPIMSHLLDWPSFAIANIVYGLTMGLWVARTPKVRAL